MKHNLRDRGAAFSPTNLTRVELEGTGGTGVALCTGCDWQSEILPSGKQRLMAHKKHREEVDADAALPPEEGIPHTTVAQDFPKSSANYTPDDDFEERAMEQHIEATFDSYTDFSGIYAGSFVNIAKAMDPDVRTEKLAARRRRVYGSHEFLTRLEEKVAAATAALKENQAANVEARKGMTVQEKFNQDRKFLESF